MQTKIMALALVCLLPVGCSAPGKSLQTHSPVDEINAVGQCLTHVLEVWPNYMGGNEPLAKKVSHLRDTEGDRSDCRGIILESILNNIRTKHFLTSGYALLYIKFRYIFS